MAIKETTKSIAASDRDTEKKDGDLAITEVDIEVGMSAEKQYSKTSVWLMVLYSGLAIGSDG